jgi:hypothetical protein
VITKSLNIHGDWMDTTTSNKHAFLQFVPASGAVFAQFELSGSGCPAISGKKNIAGSLFAETSNNTGAEQAEEEWIFSPTVQTTTGAGLFVGAKAASFTGSGAWRLTGGGNFTIKP